MVEAAFFQDSFSFSENCEMVKAVLFQVPFSACLESVKYEGRFLSGFFQVHSRNAKGTRGQVPGSFRFLYNFGGFIESPSPTLTIDWAPFVAAGCSVSESWQFVSMKASFTPRVV